MRCISWLPIRINLPSPSSRPQKGVLLAGLVALLTWAAILHNLQATVPAPAFTHDVLVMTRTRTSKCECALAISYLATSNGATHTRPRLLWPSWLPMSRLCILGLCVSWTAIMSSVLSFRHGSLVRYGSGSCWRSLHHPNPPGQYHARPPETTTSSNLQSHLQRCSQRLTAGALYQTDYPQGRCAPVECQPGSCEVFPGSISSLDQSTGSLTFEHYER